MSKTFRQDWPSRTRGALRSAENGTIGQRKRSGGISRRHFLKTTGALALAAGTGAGILFPRPARATKKKLKILCWSHTDSDVNWWFWKYCKEWGERNDIQVDIRQTAE